MGMQREFIEVSPTGVPGNPFAAGAALLWVPFFLLAHLFLLITGEFGGGLAANGYGGLYYLAISLATITYAVAGVALTTAPGNSRPARRRAAGASRGRRRPSAHRWSTTPSGTR